MIRYIKENPHCHKCEHCENRHLIGDLNGKLDEYFCTLQCRIAKHISDLDIHVTKEKKDYWDAKAEQSSIDALNDNMENVLDKLEQFQDAFGDVSDFVKKDDLNDFVTKDFIDNYVKTVINGYDFATKQYVNNYINSQFDKSNYYTKSQVDSLLNKSYSNYSITSLDYTNGILTIKQDNIGNTKSVSIGTSGGNTGGTTGGGSMSQETFDDMLKSSKTIHTLTINNKSYNPVVSDVNMTITGGGGSGSSDGGGYYKPYFKNTTYYDSFPRSEMPTDGSAPKADSGWSEQQKNPSSGEYTWMTQVFIDAAGNYGSYMDPIRLTGEKGSAGEDGSFYEYIYRRQNQNQVLPTTPDNKQQDGYVPNGWNDHPEGVDQDNRYEYVCYRIKDRSTSQWGNWFGPYLWSAYGENGTDGDGVEYIYYVGLTKPTGSLQDPSQWDTSVSGFQDNEYILNGSGWTDDPTDLTEQGQKQYVSVRKKRDNVWGAYSEPALWSYYSVDGKSDSIMMRVDGENQYIPLNSNMTNTAYNASIDVYMYDNSDTISFSLTHISTVCSDGVGYTSQFEKYLSYTLGQTQININIPDSALSFDNKYYTLKFKATSITSSVDAERMVIIKLFGVNNSTAKDAETYSLKASSYVVKYEDGSFYPKTISCYILKSVGETLSQIYPATYNSGWTFMYNVDSGSNTTLNSNSITLSNVLSSTSNSIQFIATNDSGITLSENIPVVKSGVPGLNGVSYFIEATNVAYNYTNNSSNYSVTFSSKFKLSKRQNYQSEYLDLTKYYLKYAYGSSALKTSGITDDSSSKSRTISFSDSVSDSSTVVQVYAYEQGTDAILAQILIPISSAGKDGKNGESSSQTLVGSPLRMKGGWISGTKYYDGKRAADDGVFYQDVVLYNNTYYACINTEDGEDDSWSKTPDEATYFSSFSLSPDTMFNLIIANKALIKELTSNEIVISDSDCIVAGMTSGGTIDENSDLYGKITEKGNVRIWAGSPTSKGDLTTAPFTVTDTGVIQSKGPDYTIQINNGVIYFITENNTFHLGLNSNGQPDWISNSTVYDSAQFYTINYPNAAAESVTLQLDSSSNIYYTAAGKTKASGRYWEIIAGEGLPILSSAGINYVMGNSSAFRQVLFTDGVKSYTGAIVCIGYQFNGYKQSDDYGSGIYLQNATKCVMAGSTTTTRIDKNTTYFVVGAVQSKGYFAQKVGIGMGTNWEIKDTKDVYVVSTPISAPPSGTTKITMAKPDGNYMVTKDF